VKNSGLAAVLSFFIVGLGQIYNGQFGKGFLLIFLDLACWGAFFEGYGLICLIVLWVFAIIDAYKTAEKINKKNNEDTINTNFT
jgi:TM2 domain.